MFSSLNNNGFNLFDPFNPNQATAAATTASFVTDVENPSSYHPCDSPFLPHSAAFLDNGNDSLMAHLLFQQQGVLMNSSCNNIYSSSSAANVNNAISKRKDSKKVISNNICEPKKKKKRSVGASDRGGGVTAKKPVVPRRRTGKKDRHSKIYTAQGPRDRRMRLSLQIARKFFDLQDMLGFDKASKTIEWLFSKSKAAIKELKESKAMSCGGGSDKQMGETSNGFAKRRETDLENSSSMKESRDKARERARERTMMKKMKIMRSPSSGLEMIKDTCFEHQQTNSNDLDHQLASSGTSQETLEDLGSCSLETRSTPVEISAEQEKEQEQEEEESSDVHMLEYQIDSVSLIEKFLGIRSDSSSSSIFGYSNNIGNSNGVTSEESYTGLSGNWNIMIDDRVDHHYSTGYCSTMRGNLKGTSSGNVVQAQNPNEVLGCPDQNPNFSFPMAMTSSASASINRRINGETNPSSSSVSIFDYLSY